MTATTIRRPRPRATRAAWRAAAGALGLGLALGAPAGCRKPPAPPPPAPPAAPVEPEPVRFVAPVIPADAAGPVVRERLEALREAAADGDDAATLGAYAMNLQAYGLSGASEACYARAVQLDPGEARWWNGLGMVRSGRGDLEDAAAAYARALELSPDDPPTRLRLAEVHRERGALDEALEAFEAVLASGINLPQAHAGAGRVLRDLGRPAESEAQLRTALGLAPRYGTAAYALGMTLRDQERWDEAAARLEQAARDRDLEPAVYDPFAQAVSELATGAVTALHRGIDRLQSAAGEEDLAAACALLAEAVQLDPAIAEAHAQLGAALLLSGETEAAVASLRRGLEIEPDYPDALANLALAEHRQGRHDEAAALFERALEIRPDHFDARFGLAVTTAAAGCADDAREHHRAAIALRPDDPRPYKHLARLTAEGRDVEGAIAVLREGHSRLPADDSISERLAWFLATNRRRTDGDVREAIGLAEGVADRIRHPRTLDTLAAAYAAAGRFPDAIRTAKDAVLLARERGEDESAAAIEFRVTEYRSGRPWMYVPGIP